MIIKNMFAEDIDRKINGVVKVEQDESAILVQELDEYVITKELKKHFIDFFRNYGASFEENVSDIGVWISGFFGSGKSHFLKMLSYLLENKEVQGVRTVAVPQKIRGRPRRIPPDRAGHPRRDTHHPLQHRRTELRTQERNSRTSRLCQDVLSLPGLLRRGPKGRQTGAVHRKTGQNRRIPSGIRGEKRRIVAVCPRLLRIL